MQSEKCTVFGLAVNQFVESLRFISFGDKHVKIWNQSTPKKVPFNANDIPKNVICGIGMKNGDFIVGADNGQIYILDESGVK